MMEVFETPTGLEGASQRCIGCRETALSMGDGMKNWPLAHIK
jgi:hypothetical protein